MAGHLAESTTPELDQPRALAGFQARIHLPYRSGVYRGIRVLGMLCLLGSSLGLLAAVAGLPLNWLSMLFGLLVSLVLIGFTVRPGLRKPRLVNRTRESAP